MIKDNTRLLEISLVLITGLGKFLFMDILNWRLPYIVTACLFWIGYVFFRQKKNKEILKYWGFTKTNFSKTFFELLPVAVLAIILFYFLGNHLGTNILNWHILPILLIYPLWGIIQQFIIVGLIGRNLKDYQKIKIPELVIILITATVFAIVHYPFSLLIIGTFFLAIVYTTLYLRGRNLIVLGIYHGWIGAVFFYTILERDPWMEVFSIL